MDYDPGTTIEVKMHDGPTIQLKKLERNYDPTNKEAAMSLLSEAEAKQEFITGLLYINQSRATLQDVLKLPETPLVQIAEEQLRPSANLLEQAMAELM